jgi:serine/threonine protein kinase
MIATGWSKWSPGGVVARVVRVGEFATDGERRAAEALGGLPNEWVVICNKTLVTRDGRSFEIDFLVLGEHYVFAVDEKSWRGRIHGSDQVWVRDDSSSERSPLGKINYVANVLAGELRATVPRLRDIRDHFVHGAVLLSATEERPRLRDPRAEQGVYLLDGVVEQLLRHDAAAPHDPIAEFRAGIEMVLNDLRDRPRFPKRIGDYEIEEILSNRPGSYVARAVHDQAGLRTLTVYNLANVSAETEAFYLREFAAIRLLAETGLAPESLDPFTWSDDFRVVPSVPPPGKAVATLKPPAGIDDLKTELGLAALAFEALEKVHEHRVIHRALSPDTVHLVGTLREPRRIVFSGFYAARLQDQQSVAGQLDALVLNDPYAAPELALSYGFAERASDVYSLALIFAERLSGLPASQLRAGDGREPTREQFAERWSQLPPQVVDVLADLFQRALRPELPAQPDDRSSGRPTPAECAARLRAALRALRAVEAEQEGALLDGRYFVRRTLGEGTSGKTYLVEDRASPNPADWQPFAAKVFHHPEDVYAQGIQEFRVLQSVHSPHLPRLYDFYPAHQDVHLKMDYVSGQPLSALRNEFPWNEARWWRFADGLLSALETLERYQLRHRDIKPDNIIVRAGDDQPVLVDFSFVVRVGAAAAPAGSIGYLPPDARSATQPPESCDRYAAAVVLHLALTGLAPADDLVGVELSPRVQRLREVLLRACSPIPQERYAAAAELRSALEVARRAPELESVGLVASGLVRQINPWVDGVRGLYRDSATGNADNRGLDTEFARETYVPTALDERLLPAILTDRPPAVFLSGNPGDGKTAFLERVHAELLVHGATEMQRDASGWELALDGHTFRSCYDASESSGELSADAQLSRRLAGLEGDDPPAGSVTALVAINDGRLADFFARHEERFFWLANQVRIGADDGMTDLKHPWVIDLKRRAFVQLADTSAGPSVFQRVLDKLVEPARWEICGSCQAQSVCPMLANARALHGTVDGGQARRRLERLAALVHLRREFHPTMRDLRSALAFLVTANLSCDQVHRAREGVARAELLGAESHFWQRAFTPPPEADELLLGMGQLDPGLLSRPRLDRYLAVHDRDEDAHQVAHLFTADDAPAVEELRPSRYPDLLAWLAAAKRRLFFHGQLSEVDGTVVEPTALLPYRHAERFLAALGGQADLDQLRADLARGISHSDGIAVELLGGALCVKVQHSDAQQLTVLKRFPLEDFAVTVVRPRRQMTIEAIPEILEFAYRGGTPTLAVGLDLFELLARFAEGLRPLAPEYQPLLEDLAPFKNSLNLAATNELVLLEAERRVHRIVQRGGKIVRLVGA